MGAFNAGILDTNPGACDSNPWTPPAEWDGDADDYKALLRQRWTNIGWGQRMLISMKYASTPRATVECRGPHARTAGDILTLLMKEKGSQANLTFERI